MCWFECFVDKNQSRDVHREMIDSHNFFIPPKDYHQFNRKVFLTTWGLLSFGDDGDLNEPSKWNHWTIAAKVWWSASQWAGHCEGWQWWEIEKLMSNVWVKYDPKIVHFTHPPKRVRFSEDFDWNSSPDISNLSSFGQSMPPCDRIATARLIPKGEAVKEPRKPKRVDSPWSTDNVLDVIPRHPARSALKTICFSWTFAGEESSIEWFSSSGGCLLLMEEIPNHLPGMYKTL